MVYSYTPVGWDALTPVDTANLDTMDAGIGRALNPPVGSLPASGATVLDLDDDKYVTQALTGNPSYTTSNRAAGRGVTVKVDPGGTNRSPSFPAGWTWMGLPEPATFEAERLYLMTVFAWGPDESDVMAALAVEAS